MAQVFRATVLATVAALLLAAPASASFPGKNGKIAFGSFRDGNWDIWTMNPDGSAQTRLTTNLSVDLQPAWSPDGSKIAFLSQRDSTGTECDHFDGTICGVNNEIYVMNADGTGLRRLTDFPSGEPAWSPDGLKIACGGESEPTGGGVFIANADGSGLTNLVAAGGGGPVWSPDGKKIAFIMVVDSSS
jgi:Tol biopolymer transport system component